MQLFSCEFCEIFFHKTTLAILATASQQMLLLFIDLSLTFLRQLARQLSYTHCVRFTTQLFFMIAAAIFPVFYFLFLKLNLFPALHLCSILIYINYLNKAIKFSVIRHFADDTNILYANKSLRKINQRINSELKNIVHWLHANRIALNASKTKAVIFRSRKKI